MTKANYANTERLDKPLGSGSSAVGEPSRVSGARWANIHRRPPGFRRRNVRHIRPLPCSRRKKKDRTSGEARSLDVSMSPAAANRGSGRLANLWPSLRKPDLTRQRAEQPGLQEQPERRGPQERLPPEPEPEHHNHRSRRGSRRCSRGNRHCNRCNHGNGDGSSGSDDGSRGNGRGSRCTSWRSNRRYGSHRHCRPSGSRCSHCSRGSRTVRPSPHSHRPRGRSQPARKRSRHPEQQYGSSSNPPVTYRYQ